MTNMFVREVTMGAGSSYTENGAISYGSFGTSLMDQFGKAGVYRGRHMGEVFAEQSALWAEDEESALRFPFYLRMVTRKTKLPDGTVTDTEIVQRYRRLINEETIRLEKMVRGLLDVSRLQASEEIPQKNMEELLICLL